jgi:hypothetical protein
VVVVVTRTLVAETVEEKAESWKARQQTQGLSELHSRIDTNAGWRCAANIWNSPLPMGDDTVYRAHVWAGPYALNVKKCQCALSFHRGRRLVSLDTDNQTTANSSAAPDTKLYQTKRSCSLLGHARHIL